MDIFDDKINDFLSEFGKGKKMVLSTSDNGRVSSRMMSVVRIEEKFYFQTDTEMKKYRQLKANNYVALCIDNIQIEGICEEIGHPLNNTAFCEGFRECFKNSYEAYTALKNERLFCVKPLYIERWKYQDNIPYIESFDMNTKQYDLKKYEGI